MFIHSGAILVVVRRVINLYSRLNGHNGPVTSS